MNELGPCVPRKTPQPVKRNMGTGKCDPNVPLVMFPFRACKLLVAADLSYQSVKVEDRSVYGGSRLLCLSTHVQFERWLPEDQTHDM